MDETRPRREPAVDWLGWLPGLGMLAAVVVASLHFSQAREFVRVAERARPFWLIAAVALQALTYAVQGEVFRTVAKARGFQLQLPTAYRLSLLKLFADQAFPSLGLSGTAAAARELKQTGMPRALIATCVVVSIASYQIAYATAVLAALAILAAHRRANLIVVLTAVAFAFVVASWSVVAIQLADRSSRLPRFVARLRPLRVLLEFVHDAEAALTRDARILTRSSACQIAIIALDATTMWLLLLSLGEAPAPDVVYASFVLASILRTIGFVPGGLGTFEAMSVLALNLAGISVSAALAATLMFRALSFWLPMFVGLLLYRTHRRHDRG